MTTLNTIVLLTVFNFVSLFPFVTVYAYIYTFISSASQKWPRDFFLRAIEGSAKKKILKIR